MELFYKKFKILPTKMKEAVRNSQIMRLRSNDDANLVYKGIKAKEMERNYAFSLQFYCYTFNRSR